MTPAGQIAKSELDLYTAYQPNTVKDMKNITVAVDDETYWLVQIKAAENGTSVSEMIRDYLNNLTKSDPQPPERTLSEIIASIRARGGGINPVHNLTREELYNRDALR